tara:strand:+ start:4643 stop:6034 length:1392 start_codon:yes stop_codon:yes gene_type:complete
MTQLTPNGIKFKDEDQEQTKAVCSVDGVGPDSSGNIPVNFSSINTDLTDLENRLDNIGDGASSYTLSATPNPVDEGVSVTITLDTTNVFQGEEIPYTITPNGVSLTDDFVSPIASTGHFKIENDTADLVLAIKEDDLTESSPESFTLTVNAGNNPYITVNINDTSQTPVPTYSLLASPNPASENQTVTVTLSTTNVSNGTYVPYTISTSGLSLTQDFTSTVASTGNFQVYNNQATRTFTLKEDNLTEPTPESFTLTVNAGNNPTVTVGVSDSSQTPNVTTNYSFSWQSYTETFAGWQSAEWTSNGVQYPGHEGVVAEQGHQYGWDGYLTISLIASDGYNIPPVGTILNWRIEPEGGFGVNDFTWQDTADDIRNGAIYDGFPFETIYPGALSGTLTVKAFGHPTYTGHPWVRIKFFITVDNIPESGEAFTFYLSVSDEPNAPEAAMRVRVPEHLPPPWIPDFQQ